MKFEIKSRFSGAVLFSLETESLKLTLEAAVKSGAYLRGADLRGAYLGGADLYGANLRGADLYGANLGGANLGDKKLIGGRPFLQMGPIGSRSDYLLAFLTDKGIYIRTGCFEGTLEQFQTAVRETHGAIGTHAEEYTAALVLIGMHAQLWMPKAKAVAA